MIGTLDKLVWRWNRFRQMSAEEVLHRAWDAMYGLWELVWVAPRWERQLRSAKDWDEPNLELLAKMRCERWLPPAHVLDEKFPELVRDVLYDAEYLMSHQIRIFGQSFRFGPMIDWHRNFETGTSVPVRFYRRLDYRDRAQVGEAKYTWELNRHQHLLRLAQAYQLTKEAQYKDEAFEQLASWVQQNPPLRGVNWTRALEVALRLVSWAWTLAQLWPPQDHHRESARLLLLSARMHLRYLSRHLSYGSSANNHLIGELLGLAWGQAAFESGGESAARRTLRRLFREIEARVLPDGVSDERSTYYHSYVLMYGLLGEVLASWLGEEVPHSVARAHDGMARFLLDLHAGDGVFPMLGDEDGGHVLPLASEPNLPRDALELWAVLRGRLLPESLNPPGQMTYWLLGKDVDTQSTGHKVAVVRLYREAGYAVSRWEGDGLSVLVFDAGPLGDDRLAAHGHADCLSLAWYLDGQPILLDPGTYAYDGDRKWREALRSTAAHSTAVVDGQSQAIPGGTFVWKRRYRARLLRATSQTAGALLVGEHDGYARLGVRHRRFVVQPAGTAVTVIDRFTGSGVHRLELFFHCPGETLEIREPDRHVVIAAADYRMDLLALGSVRRTLRVFHGDHSRRLGWYSPRFGTLVPCFTVGFAYEGPLPVSLVTQIQVTRLFENG